MPTYSDLSDLANNYNFTGNLSGTSSVPGLSLDEDEQGNYIITYTHFRSPADIILANYYETDDLETQHIVSGSAYRQDIEDAINSILNPTSAYSVLFSNVSKISFQESDDGIGNITFAQMTGDFRFFDEKPERTAITYPYINTLANAEKLYGDIWINMENDSVPSIPGLGINVWTADSQVVAGTGAYKILMEEISHSLGVDILDSSVNPAIPRNSELDSHKYTITSYHTHPDMQYEDIVTLGITEGVDVYGPFPKGLQLFDIATLQEIYGRNYSERNTETTYSKLGAFASSRTDGSFVYTIWDGGGTDAIFATDYTKAVQIDLRQGRFSSIGNDGNNIAVTFDSGAYDAGNVAIAYFTVIENATGTNDELNGDILIGNAWDNVLRGLDGNDFLYGDGAVYDGETGFLGWEAESGNPMYAGDFSGNDILVGGAGNDYIYGGAGSDTYVYNLGDGNDQWFDSDWSESNVIQFSEEIISSSLGMTIEGNALLFTLSDGSTVTVSDFLTSASVSSLTVEYGVGSLRTLRATLDSFDNLLIISGQGDDFLVGNSANNQISGQYGDDIIFAGAGDDEIFAGPGNDIVYAGAGNDQIDVNTIGNGGDDIIYGGDGDDYIVSGDGPSNDILYGEQGDDTIILSPGNTVYGGDGNDYIQTNSVYFDNTNANIFIDAGDGNDEIHAAGLGVEVVSGNGNDIIYGPYSIYTLGNDLAFSVFDVSGNDVYGLTTGINSLIEDISGDDY